MGGHPIDALFGRYGQRRNVVRQVRGGGERATAGCDDVLRGDGLRQDGAGHAVGRGGVEVIAGEERPGRVLCHAGAVEKQRAAVGVLGAELDVVAHHQHRHAPAQQLPEHLGQGLLEFRVQTLGRLVQQQNVRVLQQQLRQRRPLLLPAGEVIGVAVQQRPQPAEGCHIGHFFLPQVLRELFSSRSSYRSSRTVFFTNSV